MDSSLKRVPAIKGLGQALVDQQKVQSREGCTKSAICERMELLKKKAIDKKVQVMIMIKDPEFQKHTISTGAGAITLGSMGGAFGTATGVFVGGAAGIVPALLTFGLSIPAGACVGGVTGLLVGVSAGGSAGAASGFCVYKYRVQIKNGIVEVRVKVEDGAKAGYIKLTGAIAKTRKSIEYYADAAQKKVLATKDLAKAKTMEAHKVAKAKAAEAKALAKVKAGEAITFATTTRPGVTSSCAAAGTALGSVAGGTCGLVAGAAVGVVPALLTFGLSIPIGAGIGLATGATAGAGAGALTGGTAGFAGFTYRKELKNSAGYIQMKTVDSAKQVKQSVRKLVGAGTGETN